MYSINSKIVFYNILILMVLKHDPTAATTEPCPSSTLELNPRPLDYSASALVHSATKS